MLTFDSIFFATRRFAAVLILILAAPLALAEEWTLNNDQSSVHFVSIKAGNLAEVHSFNQLSGVITASGEASVEIQLASVDTLIPIRDDRMREFLFESNLFPTAAFTVDLSETDFSGAEQGGVVALNGTLALKDRQIPLSVEAQVLQSSPDTVLVSSAKPILLSAGQLGLSAGVAKLQELAGLPSISDAVPLTFSLTFNKAQPTAAE